MILDVVFGLMARSGLFFGRPIVCWMGRAAVEDRGVVAMLLLLRCVGVGFGRWLLFWVGRFGRSPELARSFYGATGGAITEADSGNGGAAPAAEGGIEGATLAAEGGAGGATLKADGGTGGATGEAEGGRAGESNADSGSGGSSGSDWGVDPPIILFLSLSFRSSLGHSAGLMNRSTGQGNFCSSTVRPLSGVAWMKQHRRRESSQHIVFRI